MAIEPTSRKLNNKNGSGKEFEKKAINQNDLIRIIKSDLEASKIVFKNLKEIIHECLQINDKHIKAKKVVDQMPLFIKSLNNVLISIINSQALANTKNTRLVISAVDNMNSIHVLIDHLHNLISRIEMFNKINFNILVGGPLFTGLPRLFTALGTLCDNIFPVLEKIANQIQNIIRTITNGFNVSLKTYILFGLRLMLVRSMFNKIAIFIVQLTIQLMSLNVILLARNFVKFKFIEQIIKSVSKTITTILRSVSTGNLIRIWLLGSIALKSLTKAMLLIRSTITTINMIGSQINTISTSLIVSKLIMLFEFIRHLINEVASLPIGPVRYLWLTIKLNNAAKLILRINILILAVNSVMGVKIAISRAFAILIFMKMIDSIVSTLRSIYIGFVMYRVIKSSLNRFLKLTRLVQRIIISLALRRTPGAGRAFRQLMIIHGIVLYIGMLVGALILMTPLFLAFILLSPIIMLCLWVTSLLLRFIINMLFKIVSNPKLFVTLLLVLALISILTLITFEMFLLALMLPKIMSSIADLGLFLLSLIGLVVALGVLGFLLSLALPVMPAIFIGLGMVVLLIGLLIVIALELYVISALKLDPEKIKFNVKTVLETAYMVIESVFESVYNPDDNAKNKPWYEKVLNWMGGSVAMLASAILSVAILSASLVSIGLILFMAAQLRLLQVLDLNPDKIRDNVKTVIETAKTVISVLFDENNKDDRKDKKSNKSWISTVIREIGGKAKMIADAIMSVAFLAISIVSITLILFIAVELRLLQSLDLQVGKIKENVKTVIDTTKLIIELLFNNEDEVITGVDEKKSWMRSVLEFAGGRVLMIIDAILAIGFLAISIVSIYLVIFIALQLKYLQSINLEYDKIRSNVKAVIDTTRYVISSIFAKDETQFSAAPEWLRPILEFVIPTNLIRFIDTIMSIGLLGVSLVAVYLVRKIANELTAIQKLPDLSQVRNKVKNVISVAKSVVAEVSDQRGPLINVNLTGLSLKRLANLSKNINSIGESIKNMLPAIINIPSAQTTTTKFNDAKFIINECISLINTLEKMPQTARLSISVKLSTLSLLQSVIEGFGKTVITPGVVANTGAVIDNYIKFLDKVNYIDITKLKTTENMFAHMAKFSESISGNFDGLADALNDKIAPLLEEINNILKETNSIVTDDRINNYQRPYTPTPLLPEVKDPLKLNDNTSILNPPGLPGAPTNEAYPTNQYIRKDELEAFAKTLAEEIILGLKANGVLGVL